MIKTLTASVLCLLSAWALPLPASAAGGALKFKANQSWEIEQSMSYAMTGADGKTQNLSNKNVMKFKVVKLYGDGSALLEVSAGAQVPKSYQLATGSGRTYVVNALNPEMAAMMGDGAADDLAALKSASDPKEWLGTEGRSPIDAIKVPAEPLAVGKTADWMDPSEEEKWVVSRLKDETLSKLPCEVYEAKISKGSTPITETVWLARKEGFVVKKKIVQGGSQGAEIVQTRLVQSK